MEKFAYMIEQLFQEKLSVYKKLKKVFELEKKYIVDMDVDSLWKMTDMKKQLTSEIEQIRERILESFEKNDLSLNMDYKTNFSLSRVIDSLPVPAKRKSNLKKLRIQLDIVKEELAGLTSENKRYANEYLAVIKGIFTTITGSRNREQYTSKGVVLKDKSPRHLLSAEV